LNQALRQFKICEGRSRLLTAIGNDQRCAYAYRQQELASTKNFEIPIPFNYLHKTTSGKDMNCDISTFSISAVLVFIVSINFSGSLTEGGFCSGFSISLFAISAACPPIAE
jgi:hypothetical protein